MTISADNLCKSAREKINGCETYIYNHEVFSNEFIDNNHEVLRQKRGAGYWLWKPYIINGALFGMNENDLLIYCDAGLTFEQNIDKLLSQMDQDIYVFGNKYKHFDWCKMDVLEAMGCNKPEFAGHEQLQASCLIVKPSEFSRNFVKKWLLWAQMPGFIDDSPSKKKNHNGFIEHRHDQAILTNLAITEGLKLHWWPVQYMLRHHHKHPNDNNQVIWLHHRKRNNEW